MIISVSLRDYFESCSNDDLFELASLYRSGSGALYAEVMREIYNRHLMHDYMNFIMNR